METKNPIATQGHQLSEEDWQIVLEHTYIPEFDKEKYKILKEKLLNTLPDQADQLIQEFFLEMARQPEDMVKTAIDQLSAVVQVIEGNTDQSWLKKLGSFLTKNTLVFFTDKRPLTEKITTITNNLLRRNTERAEAKNQSLATQEAVKNIFQYEVDNFWPSTVGRPELVSYIDSKGIKQETLVQLGTGDKIIQVYGHYAIGMEQFGEFKPQGDYKDFAIKIAFEQLKAMIFTRRQQYEQGVSITPLPRKKNYHIIFELDRESEGEFVKVSIPGAVFFDTNISEENRLGIFKGMVYTAINSEELKGKKNIDRETYQRRLADGDFERLCQDPRLQNEIADLNSPYAADLRIAIRQSSTLKDVQNSADLSACGVGIPTTIALGFKEDVLETIHAIHSHPFIDGKEASVEAKAVLGPIISAERTMAKAKKLTTNQGATEPLPPIEDIVNYQPEIKKRTDELPTFKQTSEASYIEQIRVVSIGDETGNSPDNVINQMYAFINGPKRQELKQKYGLSLSPAVLLNYAIIYAAGINHAHFLDKSEEKVVPIECGLPYGLKKLLTDPNQPLTKNEQDNIIAGLVLFQSARFDAANPGTFRKGRGALEVLQVTAGKFKNLLSNLAKISSPQENEIATNSMLISMLLEKDPQQVQKDHDENGFAITEFSTSKAEVYQQYGSFGVCQNSPSSIHLSYRPGTTDLVTESYGTSKEGEVKLQQEVTKALRTIIQWFSSLQ